MTECIAQISTRQPKPFPDVRKRSDTLYNLTQVPDQILKAAIKDGRVNPKMKGKDVDTLRGSVFIPDKQRSQLPASWMTL